MRLMLLLEFQGAEVRALKDALAYALNCENVSDDLDGGASNVSGYTLMLGDCVGISRSFEVYVRREPKLSRSYLLTILPREAIVKSGREFDFEVLRRFIDSNLDKIIETVMLIIKRIKPFFAVVTYVPFIVEDVLYPPYSSLEFEVLRNGCNAVRAVYASDAKSMVALRIASSLFSNCKRILLPHELEWFVLYHELRDGKRIKVFKSAIDTVELVKECCRDTVRIVTDENTGGQ